MDFNNIRKFKDKIKYAINFAFKLIIAAAMFLGILYFISKLETAVHADSFADNQDTSLSSAACNLKQDFKEYDYFMSKRDHKKDSETLSYVLDLSYSPVFCAYSKKFKQHTNTYKHQCQDNKFGLVVHGLWGQGRSYKHHPRNCKNTKAIRLSTSKQYLCIMPGIDLIQKEWEKHGTCDFETPELYLLKIQKLYSQLQLPSYYQLQQLHRSSNRKQLQKLIITKICFYYEIQHNYHYLKTYQPPLK